MRKIKGLTIFLSLLLSIGFVVNAQETYTWEELAISSEDSPIAARTDAKMLLNDAENIAYITCGTKGLMGEQKDTWAFDLTAQTWTLLEPNGTPPAGGGEGATAVDPVNLKLYYLDRAGKTGNLYDNVKVFDAKDMTWTQLETTGTEDDTPYSISGAMAYDNNENRLIYFGGSYWEGDTIYLNDTYTLDLETLAWTKLNTRGNPEGRTFFSAIYNSVDNTFVIFGGQTAEYISAEFYQLKLDENLRWEPIIPANPISPDGRIKASMTYDPLGNRIFLYGGTNGSNYYDAIDIYDFALSQWSTPSVTGDIPTERKGMASDIFIPSVTEESSLPYLVIFGGDNKGTAMNDVWRIYFDLIQPQPKDPVMTVKTNQSSYTLGDTLTATYDLVNEGPATNVDLAIALMLPNNDLYFLMAFTKEGSYYAQGVALGAGESKMDQTIFSIKINDPLPTGTYGLYCVILKNGKLVGSIKGTIFSYK